MSYEEGNEFYMNNQLDMFFEASAKEGLNSSEIFTQSVEMLYDCDKKRDTFYLNESNDKDGNNGKSCEECY